MDCAIVANQRDRNASCSELAAIGLALVAQHVVLVNQEQRLGQALELLRAGVDWRDVNVGALGNVGQILIPEPFHRLFGQPWTFGKLLVGAGRHRGVGDWVEALRSLARSATTAVMLPRTLSPAM